MRATDFITERLKLTSMRDSPARKFIDAMHAKFPEHPTNPVAFVMPYEDGHAMVILAAMPGKADTVYIEFIGAEPQQAGIGKRALNDLQSMAAQAGIKFKLYADAKFGTPKQALQKLYRGAGFKQHGDSFSWEPQIDEDTDMPSIGINVRSDVRAGMPYADLIVDGVKTYESRESNSLNPYIGKRVGIVKTGEGKAHAIGSVVIGEPIIVNEHQFRELEAEHMVPAGSAFDIKQGQKKVLYPLSDAVRFDRPIDVSHGIVSRKLNLDEEIIDEGATSILYHYTGTKHAYEILQSGEFQLSSVTGAGAEQQYAPEGYPYFLSTTRTRTGDYHRYVGTSAVMFVLDGNWFNQRYPVKPIDYWERSWLHTPDRTREAEDRVFSKESSIPIGGVKQVHVLIKEQNEFRSPLTRKLLILAKKQGIPAYLYTDERAWRLLDTRRAVNPSEAGDVLRGQEPTRVQRNPFDYLTPWLELLYKNSVADLSEKANKIRYNLIYYGDGDQGLGTEMGNARKPGNEGYETSIKINNIMRKNGFKTTLDLARAVKDKWKNIKAQ